jgi:hypothetical protein
MSPEYRERYPKLTDRPALSSTHWMRQAVSKQNRILSSRSIVQEANSMNAQMELETNWRLGSGTLCLKHRSVMLSLAKHLHGAERILRCAQDDIHCDV